MIPAVNVKCYASITDEICDRVARDSDPPPEGSPAFNLAWIERLPDARQSYWYESACAQAWEHVRDDAGNIWGWPAPKVYAEGRSSGWAVIPSLPPFDSWNAIDLGKWRRFEKWAQTAAADVPYLMADLIYHNVYLPECESARVARVRPDCPEEVHCVERGC